MPPTFGLSFIPPDGRVAVHHGTIDSAPPAGDLLLQCGILRGHLSPREVLDSHPPEVHSSDPVVIGPIAALAAAEQMLLLDAVCLLRMAADRACL